MKGDDHKEEFRPLRLLLEFHHDLRSFLQDPVLQKTVMMLPPPLQFVSDLELFIIRRYLQNGDTKRKVGKVILQLGQGYSLSTSDNLNILRDSDKILICTPQGTEGQASEKKSASESNIPVSRINPKRPRNDDFSRKDRDQEIQKVQKQRHIRFQEEEEEEKEEEDGKEDDTSNNNAIAGPNRTGTTDTIIATRNETLMACMHPSRRKNLMRTSEGGWSSAPPSVSDKPTTIFLPRCLRLEKHKAKTVESLEGSNVNHEASSSQKETPLFSDFEEKEEEEEEEEEELDVLLHPNPTEQWKKPYAVVASIQSASEKEKDELLSPNGYGNYPLFPKKKPYPAVGDVLAYRVLSLSEETWQPALSPYEVGTIRSVNPRRGEVCIEDSKTKSVETLEWVALQDVRLVRGPTYDRFQDNREDTADEGSSSPSAGYSSDSSSTSSFSSSSSSVLSTLSSIQVEGVEEGPLGDDAELQNLLKLKREQLIMVDDSQLHKIIK